MSASSLVPTDHHQDNQTVLPSSPSPICAPQKRKNCSDDFFVKKSKHLHQDDVADGFANLHLHPLGLLSASTAHVSSAPVRMELQEELVAEERAVRGPRRFLHVKRLARLQQIPAEGHLAESTLMHATNMMITDDAGVAGFVLLLHPQ